MSSSSGSSGILAKLTAKAERCQGEFFMQSELPAVFDPGGGFLVGGAELDGIGGVSLLGDEALVKVAAEAGVDLLEELAPPDGSGLPFKEGRGDIETVGLRPAAVEIQDGPGAARQAGGGIGAEGFEALRQTGLDEMIPEGIEAAWLAGIGKLAEGIIEHDEAAAANVMAAFEGFAVEPFKMGLLEFIQSDGELLSDAQPLELAVEHGAGGDMDESAPAVVFGFIEPLAGLGAGFIERAAVDRAGGIGDRVHAARRARFC